MVKYKESESESDGASVADEPRFRVRVCMQRVFGAGDARARAYLCVSPRRRVRWLQRRLRRLFALPQRLRLLSRGHLLPPQEPLALLQPDDPVEVVPEDAKPDDGAGRDEVDSIVEMQVSAVREHDRSPPAVCLDDLTETKRQALLMLEQYCAEPAPENAPRPRRRRVRRRRRVLPAALSPQSGGSAGSDGEPEPARGGAGPDGEPAPARGGAGPDGEPAPARGGAGPDGEPAPARGGAGPDGEPAPARIGSAVGLRNPAAMVLRNELQPRAPRVVRPLTDRMPATLLDSPPAEVVMG